MRENTARPLMILTGIVCLVVAGWLAIHQFNQDEGESISKSKIRIGNTKATEDHLTKRHAQSRSLEELKQILADARGQWAALAGTRYFFEDYADEVVAKFSPTEIELLGFDCTRTDYRTSLGFDYAIMRRWGQLDFEKARSRVFESHSIAKNGGQGSSYLLSFYERLFESLRIGRSVLDPAGVIADIFEQNNYPAPDDSFNTFDSHFDIGPALFAEVFENLTLKDPEASRSLIANTERLAQLATDPDPFATDHSSIAHLDAILSGYFKGLPEGTKWHEVFESLDPSFRSFALASMIGRWMGEDLESSITWLNEQPVETLLTMWEATANDPFAEPEKTPDQNDYATRFYQTLGSATAEWFKTDPSSALNSIDNQLKDGEAIFFEEVLLEVAKSHSPIGFMKTLDKLGNHQDPFTRGDVILRLEKHHALLSIAPALLDYEPVAFAQKISSIEVAPEQKEPIEKIVELLRKD